MGRHRTEEPQGHLHRLADECGTLFPGHAVERVPLEVVQRVHQLHDGADRGIEVEVSLHVGGDAADRLVDGPAEGTAGLGEGVRGAAAASDHVAMDAHEAPEPVEKAGGALDAALRPFEITLRGSGEQGEEPGGVRSEAADHVVRIHDIPLGLGHLGPVLDHHALREEGRERLVERDHAHVAQHLRVEARVEEVEHRVLDAADVLVHGHPVLRRLPLEHALLVSGRAVAEEVPGGFHEGIHGVGVAPGPASALGTGGVDEARHFREW